MPPKKQKKGTVLVFGAAGALGDTAVTSFRSGGWSTVGVDFRETKADQSVLLSGSDSQSEVAEKILKVNATYEAIVCVAGGWAGGNAETTGLFDSAQAMWTQSVQSSLVAAHVASKKLEKGGLLVLTGAVASLGGTPGMIGYGIAKAAVHQLIASLAESGSGLPEEASVVGILPITLDTPMNRKGMPDADFSSWTPLNVVADKIASWVGGDRPQSGSLMKIETVKGSTTFEPAKEGTGLAGEKCCAFNDLKPLPKGDIPTLHKLVAGWDLVVEDGMQRLRRKYEFQNFVECMAFFEKVKDIAEDQGHHPDLHLTSYKDVRIDIYTHVVGGLSRNDFILAAKLPTN